MKKNYDKILSQNAHCILLDKDCNIPVSMILSLFTGEGRAGRVEPPPPLKFFVISNKKRRLLN